jgi:hypothetical protein
VRPKTTSAIPSYSSQTKMTFSLPSHSSPGKTDFLYSTPFQSGQNRLPPFQAIPVEPKLTSSIPSYSNQATTDFLSFRAIPVRAKIDLLNAKPFQSDQT